MTRSAPAQRADAWISRIATATVAGLAGTAGAISYSRMRQFAATHGDTGWHAHAFLLSVDGVEIVASLVLLADRRAGRKSGWLPWAALAAGTAASLAANIATAEAGTISRINAGWPAFALLIAVKFLSGILEHGKTADPAPLADSCESDGQSRPAPAVRSSRCPRPDGSPAVRTTTTAEPQPGTDRKHRPAVGIDDLLPAACAVRDDLRTNGRSLTRDALAARLRATGYRIGNDRLTSLLLAVKDPAAT